jgi:hypothetical protein
LYASAQFLDFLDLAKNCQFLYWKLNRHVRYIGINAPEIAHDNHKAEPFGYAAKKYNQSLVRSKKKCGIIGMKKSMKYMWEAKNRNGFI